MEFYFALFGARFRAPTSIPTISPGFLEAGVATCHSLSCWRDGLSVITRVMLGYAVLIDHGGAGRHLFTGGWLAAAPGILLLLGFLLCHRNHRLRAALVLVVLLAGGGIFIRLFLVQHGYLHAAGGQSRKRIQSPGVMDATSRLRMWSHHERMWRDHAWFGRGARPCSILVFANIVPKVFRCARNTRTMIISNCSPTGGSVGGVIVLGGIGFSSSVWSRPGRMCGARKMTSAPA